MFSLLGRDAAFLGPDDNQYAILEEDRTSLNLFNLKAVATKEALENNAAVLEENTFADNVTNPTERQGPMQFTFESEVDRIFSAPLGRLWISFSFSYCFAHLPRRFHQRMGKVVLSCFFFFCGMKIIAKPCVTPCRINHVVCNFGKAHWTGEAPTGI